MVCPGVDLGIAVVTPVPFKICPEKQVFYHWVAGNSFIQLSDLAFGT